jgi:hypothetical protein
MGLEIVALYPDGILIHGPTAVEIAVDVEGIADRAGFLRTGRLGKRNHRLAPFGCRIEDGSDPGSLPSER